MTKPAVCGTLSGERAEQPRGSNPVRKVRASQGRITANGRRGRPQGKCNRDIPPALQVRVERCGKSAPARRRLRGHVNPIRSNIVEKHIRRPGGFEEMA